MDANPWWLRAKAQGDGHMMKGVSSGHLVMQCNQHQFPPSAQMQANATSPLSQSNLLPTNMFIQHHHCSLLPFPIHVPFFLLWMSCHFFCEHQFPPSSHMQANANFPPSQSSLLPPNFQHVPHINITLTHSFRLPRPCSLTGPTGLNPQALQALDRHDLILRPCRP